MRGTLPRDACTHIVGRVEEQPHHDGRERAANQRREREDAHHLAARRHRHTKAARRIYHYIAQTPTYGLQFSAPKQFDHPLPLECWSDADWACDEDCKPTSGGLIRFNGNIFAWLVRTQNSMGMLSALSLAARQLISARNLVASFLKFSKIEKCTLKR